ncbi:hypothetical protein Ancab_027667 [Ancistrocladus abbreviatus]
MKWMGYNDEIPFEKNPLPRFYDVAEEDREWIEQPQFPTTIEELEGERRVDREAQLRKQDIAKNKITQRQDALATIMQANKLNDLETVRNRSNLVLPPLQVSDNEFKKIAKMVYAIGVSYVAMGDRGKTNVGRFFESNIPAGVAQGLLLDHHGISDSVGNATVLQQGVCSRFDSGNAFTKNDQGASASMYSAQNVDDLKVEIQFQKKSSHHHLLTITVF